ncbi:unnamed protein product [Bursaphelenchus xylophilus]|nr:unnamed protein product [Bursaphelenchus xylophilus]CAG9087151.1 unnamed protein product [Bursaphelenchus xylophilus]
MIWVAFKKAGGLPLTATATQMKGLDYYEVLGEHLVPYWQSGYTFVGECPRPPWQVDMPVPLTARHLPP